MDDLCQASGSASGHYSKFWLHIPQWFLALLKFRTIIFNIHVVPGGRIRCVKLLGSA